MLGWSKPLQRASFRGVRFEVINVEDELIRATVEHAYPFVNGADVEDFGLNPLTVRMQAVFFGQGYHAELLRFLEALQQQGAAVLVHPVRGRLPNMLCTAAQIRHEAELIDYAALDLTFVQSTPAVPIFRFEHSLLTALDRALSLIDDITDELLALFSDLMGVVFGGSPMRLLRAWGALSGCYHQLRSLFDLSENQFSLPAGVSKAEFTGQAKTAAEGMLTMIEQGTAQSLPTLLADGEDDLTADSNRAARVNRAAGTTARFMGARDESSLAFETTKNRDTTRRLKAEFGIRADFDDLLRLIEKINTIPQDLVTGKNIRSAKEQAALKSLVTSIGHEDIQDIALFMRLATTMTLSKTVVSLLEDETVLPQDVDYIITKVRSEIVANLQALRQLTVRLEQGVDGQSGSRGQRQYQPETGIYTQTHKVAEGLRRHAHEMTELALAAINRKPPLIVRSAPFSGTVQQIAHAFYADFRRSPELLKLNPQVRYPNKIQQGELLNSYAK